MFLRLWYYVRGYVMIKVKGFGLERFMNMLSYKGIYLWDISREGIYIRMKVGKNTLSLVEECCEKTACKLEIETYGGLPHWISSFKGRSIFVYGLLIFAVGLYGLSSVIWSVELEGNQRVSEIDILEFCDGKGIKAGIWKKEVDTKSITQALLLEFKELSWVSVGIYGTKINIKVSETIEKPDMIEKEIETSIVARENGVIVQVTAERGTPEVMIGDIVSEGDILISADILIGEEGMEQHTEQVHATGSVLARIWKEATDEMTFLYEEKKYEEIYSNWKASIFGMEIDFFKPDILKEHQKEYDVEMEKEIVVGFGDFDFGVSFQQELYYTYEIEEKTRTMEEIEEFLLQNLTRKLEQSLSKSGIIEKVQISYETFTDKIQATATGIMIEEIGMEQEVIWKSEWNTEWNIEDFEVDFEEEQEIIEEIIEQETEANEIKIEESEIE